MNHFFGKVVLSALIAFFLSAAGYRIFDDGGYLAVREEKSGAAWRTETRLDMLPPQDAARIRQGFVCEDGKALAHALENFCS